MESGFFCLIDVAPAVVGNDCAVVCGPDKSLAEVTGAEVFVGIFRICSENLTGHKAYAALAVISSCNAANSYSVVVYGADGAAYVGSVAVGLDHIGIIYEILTAVRASGNDYCANILVCEVYTAVYHGNDDIAAACGKVAPHRLHVDIAAGFVPLECTRI